LTNENPTEKKRCDERLAVEGGVARTIDYLIFTRSISRPGWLIYSFFITFISMKNKNLFNRKGLKSFRSFLRNKATLAEAALWDILKSKQLDRDPHWITSQSTTPAANKLCIN